MTDLSKALSIIQSFESCALTAYRDIVGVLTIGWGHTGPDVWPNGAITQEQADQMLLDDVTRVAKEVEAMLDVDVTDNQFDALVSFAYNVGAGALSSSTLMKRLNAGQNPADVADEFLRWDYAAGKEVAGLERRRVAERELFLS